jgi:hypothetical protein
MQIRQELGLLEEIKKLQAAVNEELEKQSTGELWGKQALQLMQLLGVGVIVATPALLRSAVQCRCYRRSEISADLKMRNIWLDMQA